MMLKKYFFGDGMLMLMIRTSFQEYLWSSKNQWPYNVAPFLRSDVLPYYNAVIDLSKSVLSALAYGLGKPKDFFELA